jgi:DNA-binding response OmpR family regulator
MRVLLIEDDSATAQSIELMLKSESFNVYTTDLGEEGVDLGKLYDYDIILLDLNLPDMSGYEVLRSLRVAKVKTPILILSGLAGIEDKVRGLGFGADDYLTKPFAPKELSARIRALLRRIRPIVPGHAKLVFGNLEIVPEEGKVLRDGTAIFWPKMYPGKAIMVPAHRILWMSVPGGEMFEAHYCGKPKVPGVTYDLEEDPDPEFTTICAAIRPGGV